MNSMKEELSNLDFSLILNSSDVNVAYEQLVEVLHNVCEKHTIIESVKKRKYCPKKPWITKGIIHSINRKQRLYKKYMSSKSVTDRLKYTKYRNKLNAIIQLSKKLYIAKKIQDSASDLKRTWSIIKELLGTKKSHTLPSFIMINERKIVDNESIANAFNNFFGNIGKSIAAKMQPTQCNFRDFLSQDYPMDSLYMFPTNENEVSKIIGNLKRSYATGVDGMNSCFIKDITQYICAAFTHICNLSLVSGQFPEAMKFSKVIPVYKSGDVNTLNNYRPISLLPTLSKVLERIVYNRLYKYLVSHNLLTPQQFGFRPNHSTELALLYATELISSFIDRGEVAVGIYIDLSKAFDSLNHAILLQKLSAFGIRGVAYQWFASYLQDRRQYVHFRGSNSTITNITTGIPQGSILGPLLFLLYLNDLVQSSSLFKYVLYADDTTLFLSDDDVNSLIIKTNNELVNISNWFKANKLLINTSKTKCMIFNFNKTRSIDNVILKIDNEQIPQVDYTNFLGLIIDNKLNWDRHILCTSSKMSRNIGVLNKLKSLLPSHILFLLYNTLVLPHLNYCTLIWGRASKFRLNKIQILQKRVIRICSGAHYLAHCDPLFIELKTLSLEKLIVFKTAIFMFKMNHDLIPSIFLDLFVKQFNVHTINTRKRENYRPHLFRTAFSQKQSIRYHGVNIWNNIEEGIKHLSYNNFRKILKANLNNPK